MWSAQGWPGGEVRKPTYIHTYIHTCICIYGLEREDLRKERHLKLYEPTLCRAVNNMRGEDEPKCMVQDASGSAMFVTFFSLNMKSSNIWSFIGEVNRTQFYLGYVIPSESSTLKSVSLFLSLKVSWWYRIKSYRRTRSTNFYVINSFVYYLYLEVCKTAADLKSQLKARCRIEYVNLEAAIICEDGTMIMFVLLFNCISIF